MTLYDQFLIWCGLARVALERLHWSAPWLALALVAYGIERLGYLWGPRLAMLLPQTAPLFRQRIRGLWAVILSAAWAAGSTGHVELAVLGAVSGALVPVVLKFREELAKLGGER